uniref:Fibronectin type-III domain-containing protein n=1 Tax=Strongyloides papillosus TaxID=174720 RepID=A0A0N5B250_STREA
MVLKFDELVNQLSSGWRYHVSNTKGIKDSWLNFELFYKDICSYTLASVNAPTNVKVQATSNSSVVVIWDYDDKNFDSGADGFVIKYIHEPSLRGGQHDVERWRSISIMDSKARSFEIGQLTAHKPYAFCVLTVKQSRQGPCS